MARTSLPPLFRELTTSLAGASEVLQLRGLAQVDQVAQWLERRAGPQLTVVEARTYGDVRALARLAVRSASSAASGR